MDPRRQPERTCVGCRATGSKASLLRIVRTPRGEIRPDPSGKSPGRGAYVHRDPTCLESALKRGALAGALRTGLNADEAARLRIDIEREVGQ